MALGFALAFALVSALASAAFTFSSAALILSSAFASLATWATLAFLLLAGISRALSPVVRPETIAGAVSLVLVLVLRLFFEADIFGSLIPDSVDHSLKFGTGEVSGKLDRFGVSFDCPFVSINAEEEDRHSRIPSCNFPPHMLG